VKLTAPEGGHGSIAVETIVGELVGWIEAHRADLSSQTGTCSENSLENPSKL
jgi:hypothetical protein